ncbi:hypothetical protein [Streptomyces cathayae]|uniref:Integrase n=1 Tax=Streptomyces cathayae TaxID=3031124 RepID=A0ABY8K7P0_9ACTN|nr:hypothetical protein [Streptomyces sp. HUAS 5]WGD42891.1 hypothetical protein PYS65_23650 [Streptomyces sp. HUAS 5]
MLRLLVCLRNGLVCAAEEGRDEPPPESAPRGGGRTLSERLRELNHWSSHRDGLR